MTFSTNILILPPLHLRHIDIHILIFEIRINYKSINITTNYDIIVLP